MHLEMAWLMTRASINFVPKMIKYYLGEEAILMNAPTYLPYYEKDMQYVLDNFE